MFLSWSASQETSCNIWNLLELFRLYLRNASIQTTAKIKSSSYQTHVSDIQAMVELRQKGWQICSSYICINAVWHILLIWVRRVNPESNIIPMFLAAGTWQNISLPNTYTAVCNRITQSSGAQYKVFSLSGIQFLSGLPTFIDEYLLYTSSHSSCNVCFIPTYKGSEGNRQLRIIREKVRQEIMLPTNPIVTGGHIHNGKNRSQYGSVWDPKVE